jgi:cytochrome c peroxidase
MMKKKLIGSAVLAGALFMAAASSATAMTAKERLGHMLYSDKYLSKNHNQSCMSCHHPAAGWADPVDAHMPDVFSVSFGSDRSLNGCRNAPPSGYAAFSPVFGGDADVGFVGGQFWDGREDTVADQAKGPFLNPVEMAMGTPENVLAAIADGSNPRSDVYCRLFKKAYGVDLRQVYADSAWTVTLYDMVGDAIGSFEQSQRFTRFTSKYDYYLAGEPTLSGQELAGLALFEGKAGCNACHPSAATINADGTITPPLFTDFTYDNLGVPTNDSWMLTRMDCTTDYGLGGRLSMPSEDGKFKVSSLRNIAKTPPFAHNGYFATLDEIVHFYNTRDVVDAGWPAAEVPSTVNITELGDLGLTAQEEADLVAFLKTLTDGYGDTMPANFVLPAITSLPEITPPPVN